MANVCPYCGALQGDWFIRDELLEIAYTPPKDFKLFLIKNGSVFDVLSTIEEFKDKYWKFFLYRSLETLGRCEVCRCYISFYPEMFEEYKKYPEAREILEKYGEIRKLVRHHISYKEDKTIDVCSNCHVKIHQAAQNTLNSDLKTEVQARIFFLLVKFYSLAVRLNNRRIENTFLFQLIYFIHFRHTSLGKN
jgi:uncharacterized paraquat-inducible protein A